MTAERERLLSDDPWDAWGPYLSDRQWGTVREDYSADGNAWGYFPFAHAHRRAYRWGEDGLAGISDHQQRLCVSVALWNGVDPILKERLFGLANEEGNHGEDVKEVYHHLDATPTHSYLRMLYRYPQAAFPYRELYERNRRSRLEPEYELADTGVFRDGRYFDIDVEYAKAGPHDILMRVTATNRGPTAAKLHVLPQVWFRNTWSWETEPLRPVLHQEGPGTLRALHPEWQDYGNQTAGGGGSPPVATGGLPPPVLFTDNETNAPVLFQSKAAGYFKDAFHEHIIRRARGVLRSDRQGSKAAVHYVFDLRPGESRSTRMRIRTLGLDLVADPADDFDRVFADRVREADAFYADLQQNIASADDKLVQRRAFAGLVWTKQFFHYDVARWLDGDPGQPPPPAARLTGRNSDWKQLANAHVISMPDKWEYPWYAAWDSAFHMIPFALIDAEFAKRQMLLFLSEGYLHPNGQLPAYEWNFGDANPPVHAWACWRVFQIDRKQTGVADTAFLERCLHKLLLNFGWWVNRKDAFGRNVFQGGFLGLDNIGVFDRSRPLPTGGFINQADATGWMAMYSLNLMRIALELSLTNPVYEDTAIKFFDHFLAIAAAMTNMGGTGQGLWDERDEFYYDELVTPDGKMVPLRVRSMVGLIPLFAVEVLEPELLAQVPRFAARLRWVLYNRPELAGLVSRWYEPGRGERRLLSLLRGHRMKRLLHRMLDPNEFLSDFGVRSLSKAHQKEPYRFRVNGDVLTVDYQPGEATIPNFGGNSNWRGPVWLPVNYLIVESLLKFHHYYGDDFRIEFPTGSGRTGTIREAAAEVVRRLTNLFRADGSGSRPANGGGLFPGEPTFYEYFHGDSGAGLGARAQCGWTALVAKLLTPTDDLFADLCGKPR